MAKRTEENFMTLLSHVKFYIDSLINPKMKIKICMASTSKVYSSLLYFKRTELSLQTVKNHLLFQFSEDLLKDLFVCRQ